MTEFVVAISGVLFGAVGTMIALKTFVDQIKKDARSKLEAEIAKHSQSEVKAYAAQRDFEHIRRNQEQLKEALRMLQEETEEQSKVIIELRTLHNGTYNRVESLAARLDGSTGGWSRPQ